MAETQLSPRWYCITTPLAVKITVTLPADSPMQSTQQKPAFDFDQPPKMGSRPLAIRLPDGQLERLKQIPNWQSRLRELIEDMITDYEDYGW
jgi:hypothetical protein